MITPFSPHTVLVCQCCGQVGQVVRLSRRQIQCLKLLVNGATNKTIASELYISLGTVKVYLSRLFNLLGVKDRLGAAMWALHHGEQLGLEFRMTKTAALNPAEDYRNAVSAASAYRIAIAAKITPAAIRNGVRSTPPTDRLEPPESAPSFEPKTSTDGATVPPFEAS